MPLIKFPDCGKGVNLDLSPEELQAGMWSDCTNMRFKDGYAQRFNGMSAVFAAPTDPPHYIAPYQTSAKRYWVHAGSQRVFVDDGVARTEITRLANVAVTSITRTSAVLATLQTSTPHGLTTGMTATVYNAVPAAFNVENVVVTVTGASTFTYALAVDPVVNATNVGRLIVQGAAAQPFTGARDDRWTGGTLGGILVMNNGLALPHYWSGDASKLRILPGWNAAWQAQVVRPFKNYLIALDVTKGSKRNPHMMKWSVAAVPGAIPQSWDETDPRLDAGELDIAETPDLLVDGLALGDAFIVYKQRSMYAVRYVGVPAVFQVQRIPGDSGMLFRGCAVQTPLGHVVLTAGDVVINNGQGVQSIADGWVRKFIFSNIDSSNYKRAFVTANPQRNEVLVCLPLVGSADCTMALVWNWKDKTWGKRNINATYGAVGQIDETTLGTWDADNETWDIDATTWNEDAYSPNEARLLLTESARIVAFDVSSSDDGASPLSGALERTGMWLDDAQANKLMKRILARIEAPAGAVVSVQFGAAPVPDSVPAWSDAVPFVVGTDFEARAFAHGRYLALRLWCSAPWRMRAFDIEVDATGGY